MRRCQLSPLCQSSLGERTDLPINAQRDLGAGQTRSQGALVTVTFFSWQNSLSDESAFGQRHIKLLFVPRQSASCYCLRTYCFVNKMTSLCNIFEMLMSWYRRQTFPFKALLIGY